ncbi:hypothetical protein AEP_00413 [Curvibacter sp. AEP1-3]|jgi:hypothetical protein|uniref:hypothetical protein n=1 Tax=Curvibacter sp. AEP1-3 TaxID=1844971 RepID=UPI000B3C5A3F|nr:hypothetical protein [Curvibacter sp. AEP1-3]ARV17375.1 hypothetical protein AEP_00413 [Curvibacter sp. AEP1-3]QDB70111.1 hypothetical protein [Curvibacter phage TJ1]
MSASDTTKETGRNSDAVLIAMGKLEGQLAAMTNLMQQNHQATQTRIEDLSKAVGVRFDGIEKRLATLEQNERGTAIRAAGTGALAGAIVAAGLQAMRALGH